MTNYIFIYGALLLRFVYEIDVFFGAVCQRYGGSRNGDKKIEGEELKPFGIAEPLLSSPKIKIKVNLLKKKRWRENPPLLKGVVRDGETGRRGPWV